MEFRVQRKREADRTHVKYDWYVLLWGRCRLTQESMERACNQTQSIRNGHVSDDCTECKSWRTGSYGCCQGPSWQGECQGQFLIQNSKGHSQEFNADGHMPSLLLTELDKPVAVWQEPTMCFLLVSDPKPFSGFFWVCCLCLTYTQSHACWKKNPKDPEMSTTTWERKRNPDLIWFWIGRVTHVA